MIIVVGLGSAMWPDHAWLAEVSGRVGGAFYVFDTRLFQANYLGLRERLRRHWPQTDLAYAMKANYMPAIGKVLSDMGGWAEVVSSFEYEVARRTLPANRVIFNGPIKREAELRHSLASGSHLNLDSFHEIALLKSLSKEFDQLRVGLRVCFPWPELASRFGFEVGGELRRALEALAAIPNLQVVSLHCHATRRQLGVMDHVERIERLCELAGELLPQHPIESLNIGGGLLGQMPDELRNQLPHPSPSLEEYADAIGQTFARCSPNEGMHLLVEPGTAIVADTMFLVAPVIETRRRSHGWQALLDTGINHVNPTRSAIRPVLHAITARAHGGEQVAPTYRLVGNTCMEHDQICEAFTGHLEPGDYILVVNRGAYSLNYTPPFIVACPAVVDRQGRLLKWADTPGSVLASYCQSPIEETVEAPQ